MEEQIKPYNGSYFASGDIEKGITPEVEAIYEECVSNILNNTIELKQYPDKAGYPPFDCFFVSGHWVVPRFVTEYYLNKLSRTGFNYQKAHTFCEIYRQRFGWRELYYTIQLWFDKHVRDKYFYDTNAAANDKRRAENRIVWPNAENYVLRQDKDIAPLSQDVAKFSCYSKRALTNCLSMPLRILNFITKLNNMHA